MLSAAVIHDSVTLASTDSSSNPDASFFPSVLPPPGTALTKITALRSGLTALRTAIGTEDSTSPFTTKSFPLLTSTTFGSLITAADLQNQLKTLFFDDLDAWLRDTPSPTAEAFGTHIASLAQVLPGTLVPHNVGSKISYDLHLRLARTATVNLSQAANFPDAGVNTTVGGTATVNVSVDLEMTFGVDQTVAFSDANAFFFAVTRLDYGVDSGGAALVSITGSTPSDPKGSLTIDTALHVGFNAPVATTPFATLGDLQGSGAAALWTPTDPTGSLDADLPLPNATTLGGSIVRFVGDKSVGVRAPDAFGTAAETSLSLLGEVTFGDLVTLIGQVTLRRLPSAAPSPADPSTDITKVPLTGVSLFVGTGWGTATPKGLLLSAGEGGLVLENGGVALDVEGSVTSYGMQDVALQGTLHVRMNTTNLAVNEAIPPFKPLTLLGTLPPAAVVTFADGTRVLEASGSDRMNIAKDFVLNGDFHFSATTNVAGDYTLDVAIKDLELFVGSGEGTESATGVRVSEGVLGLRIQRPNAGQTTIALDAQGRVSLEGVDKVYLNGGVHVRYNTAGNISATISIPGTTPVPLTFTTPAEQGTIAHPYICVAGNVLLSVDYLGLVQIGGNVAIERAFIAGTGSTTTNSQRSIELDRVYFDTGSSVIVQGDANYNRLKQDILRQVQQATADGYVISGLSAIVHGQYSLVGAPRFQNRDNATHTDDLDAHRRDHVVALAAALSSDLTTELGHPFSVTFTPGDLPGAAAPGLDTSRKFQNASFTTALLQAAKSTPATDYIRYRIAATDVLVFLGDGTVQADRTSVGGTNISLPSDAKGLKIAHGSLALQLELVPANTSTSTPETRRFALDARGSAEIVGFSELTVQGAARVRVNTLGFEPGSSTTYRLMTGHWNLCGEPIAVNVDPNVDQGGTLDHPFLAIDASVKLNFDNWVQIAGAVSFSKVTHVDAAAAETQDIHQFTESSTTQQIALRNVLFPIGLSSISSTFDPEHVTSTDPDRGDAASYARYQLLLANIRQEIARVEAATPGQKVSKIVATVNGSISSFGGAHMNRDSESGNDDLAQNRRDHVVSLATALSHDLGIEVQFVQGSAPNPTPHATSADQNANFSNVTFTMKKPAPTKSEIMVAGTGITGWVGYTSTPDFQTAPTKYGLELLNGQFGLLILIDPSAAPSAKKKYALHAEGELNLVVNTTSLRLIGGGKYIVDINTIAEGIDRDLEVHDPITGAKLATVKLLYTEELERVCIDGTLGINGLTLNARFLMERFHPSDPNTPLDFRTKDGALLARIYPDGSHAAEFPAFSGFSAADAGVLEWVVELRRIADWIGAIRGSSFFNTQIPLLNKSIGDVFDFANDYLRDFYSRVVWMEIEGTGALTAATVSTGILASDVSFYLLVNGAVSPTKVTIHALDTTDNSSVTGTQTPLDKLADDLNAALATAFASTEFAGLLRAFVQESDVLDEAGNPARRRAIAIANVPGKTVNRIRLTAASSADDSYLKLGFTDQQEAAERPQPNTEEALLQYIRDNVPGASALHALAGAILATPSGPTLGTDLHFTWAKSLTAHIATDQPLFGGFGNITVTGDVGITASIDLTTTLGVDLTPVETPRLRNAALVPPPSNGRLTDDATFTVILNSSRTATLGSGDHYLVHLLRSPSGSNTSQTSNNASVQDLADDLNQAFAVAANATNASDKLSQHVQAIVVGNSLVLLVKDTELGNINSLEVQADPHNVAVTELGMPVGQQARSKVKGLFFDGLSISGTLAIAASGINISANLGGAAGLVRFSAGPGTLGGSLRVTVALADPSSSSGHPRVYISTLVADIERVATYIRPQLTTQAAVDLSLPNMSASLGPVSLIDSDENLFRVYIPDVTDLHINSQPYDAATNNKGIFITLPEFSSFSHFNCLTLVDLLSGLTKLGQQLENIRGFEFINDPIPGVGVSLGEILNVGNQILDAVNGILHGDAATLTRLQHDLESLLHLPAGSLTFAVDTVANPKLDDTHRTAVFDPQGDKNAILFTAVVPSGTFATLRVKFEDDNRYAPGVDQAEASYDSTRRVLTIHYNATYTRAATIVHAVQTLITDSGPRAPPVTVALDPALGGDGSGTVSTTALRLELAFTADYRQTVPFYFRLKDYVDRLPDGPFGGAKALLGALADLVAIEASGNVTIVASATFRLSVGIDISNPCRPTPFLYDSGYAGPNTGTGIFLNAAVRGTNLDFKAGGLLGIRVRNGSITFDADGDPTTAGPGDNASINLTLKNAGPGRHYFRDQLFDLNNFDLGFTAGFSVILPVYGLSAIPLGSTADNNHDGFADNSLAMVVPSLSNLLLHGNSTGIRFAAPDIASLFNSLDVCQIIRSTPVLLDGLDELLGKIEDGLRSQVLNTNLPLVGDKLGAAANFISDFRTGLLGNIRTRLAEAGDPIGLVKEAIFAALGPAGLNLLVKVDADGQLLDASDHVITPDDGAYISRVVPITDANDIQVNCSGNNIDFKIRLLKAADLVDTSANPINFNIGIPGFGLSVDGNVRVTLGFDLKLYFGVNLNQGFYYQTDYRPASSPTSTPTDELRVFFSVTIPGLHARGQLFFLQLDVSDESDGHDAEGHPRDTSILEGYFVVDIKDPVGNDGKLTASDLQRPGLSLGDVVSAKLGIKAAIHLDLAVSFGGSAQFPRILAEFDLVWSWELGHAATAPVIGINHVQLDVGTFIGQVLAPILQEIKKVTGPLQPVVDAIQAPIPILSDLAGRPFNMLDLAELFGYLTPSSRKFIEAIATIIDVANNTPVVGDTILIPLGNIAITQDARGNTSSAPKPGGGSSNKSPSERVDGSGSGGPIQALFKKLEKIGIKFPILDISAVAQLFSGKPVSIIEYHMPVLELKAAFSQTINIWGPIAVFFGGEIGVKIDLTFGYDTYGLQKYFSSSDKNVLDIFDGFYIKDVDDNGVDVPEITFKGGLFVGAGLSVGFASLGVKGGIYAEIRLNLNDPDGDGRVRVSEIIANAKKDIRCIFDISGEVYAELGIFLKINLFFTINLEWDFARITILKFEITCPTPMLAHFSDGPNIGTNAFDGTGGSGRLVLNMGPYASLRAVDDTTDGDETFVVKHVDGSPTDANGETVDVTFGGIKQTFHGVKSIQADGGQGNDTIDLRDLGSPAAAPGADDGKGNAIDGVVGGPGNDVIYASKGGGKYSGGDGNDLIQAPDNVVVPYLFHGDAGDDTLQGGGGPDELYGDAGDDQIHGLQGDDHLYGGDGNDFLQGDEGNDTLEGGDGRDHLVGNDGDDLLLGGAGDDLLEGGVGNDRLVGNAGGDTIYGGEGDDVLVGDDGTISAGLAPVHVTGIDGAGNDVLVGEGGADVIFGCGGNDWIFGGAKIGAGTLTPVALDGVDFIDGGAGDDHIFADDAGGAGTSTFPGATVAGSVWLDYITNSIRDARETGMAGVVVELHNATDSSLVMTTVTDGAGAYKFQGLRAGSYYVQFKIPALLNPDGTPSSATYVFVTQDQGGDDTLDSDASTATGNTAPITLAEGESSVHQDAGLASTALQINIDNPSVREGNNGLTNLVFTVTLSQPVDEDVTFCYKTADGTAVEGADYLGAAWTLVFKPGETTKTITIQVVGDIIDEGQSETMYVQVCDVLKGLSRSGIVLTRTQATGTIIDDDAPPVISISDGVQIGTLDGGVIKVHEVDKIRFTVSLSNPSAQPISVDWHTAQVVGSDGALLPTSATEGVDYFAAGGTLVFAPGETEKVIEVQPKGDLLDEYDEQLSVGLVLPYSTPASLARLGDAQGIGHITDDDATPFLRFVPSVVNVIEGQSGTTPVKLRIELYDPVTNAATVSGRYVNARWSTTDGTAMLAGTSTIKPDALYALGTVQFAPGESIKEIEVSVLGDQDVEPDEYFYVNLLTAENAILDPTDRTGNHATINIINDETPDAGPWYVGFGQSHYQVNEGEGITITIDRPAGSSEPDAVLWIRFATATRGSAPGPGVDYQADFTLAGPQQRMLVSFADGETEKTLHIQTFTDNLYEGDEVVIFDLANPTGGPVRAPIPEATLVIKDLQPAPVIRVLDTTVIEGSPFAFVTVVATLPDDVTLGAGLVSGVRWHTRDGSAKAAFPDEDYVAEDHPGVVADSLAAVFTAADFGGPDANTLPQIAVKTLKVKIKDDSLPEPSENFFVDLTEASNVTIDRAEATVTLRDNDLVPVLGYVFQDVNGNGRYDSDIDIRLGGVAVKVTGANGAVTTTTTLAGGDWHANVVTGATAVEVTGIASVLVGAVCSTHNNPLNAQVDYATSAVADIGFNVPATPATVPGSTGTALVYNDDTVYGGPGNDEIDGGGGDDWLVGGHWLGPGCACSGNPYDATIVRTLGSGGRVTRTYVDPASLAALGTLTGHVWLDFNIAGAPGNNGNGLLDAGENGVANVQVNLFDENWVLVGTHYTNSSGDYRFDNLAACHYVVQFVLPDGTRFSPATVSPGDRNNDADPSTGLTSTFTVSGGATTAHIDAGLIPFSPTANGPWNVSFSAAIYSVRESDAAAIIRILHAVGTQDGDADFFTRNGTAIAGVDYDAVKTLLSFADDQARTTVTIGLHNPGPKGPPRLVRLYLANPTGGPVKGAVAQAVLLIFDDGCPDNDTISGRDGNDVILGDFGLFNVAGDGSMTVLELGGMGNDTLFGDTGRDEIHGEGGNDRIDGGRGDDTLIGGSENDTYVFNGDRDGSSTNPASLDHDTIVEVAAPLGGIDLIDLSVTSSFSVVLDLNRSDEQTVTPALHLTLPAGGLIEGVIGGRQDDTLLGTDGDDYIDGGAGNDLIEGRRGNDILIGGTGSDTYVFDADVNLGSDEIREYATPATALDHDLIDLSSTTTVGANLNLGITVEQAVNVNLHLTLSDAQGIENLYGTSQADTLTGNARDNIIWGREGSDVLDGGPSGYDVLKEERPGNWQLASGVLTLVGAGETDTFVPGSFDEISLTGDDSANVLDASSFNGLVRLDGRGGDDVLKGGSGTNYLTGGRGSDTIVGGTGIDILTEQGDGDYLLSPGTLVFTDAVTSAVETDTLSGIEQVSLTGGAHGNRLDASAWTLPVTLDGGAGNDQLLGGAGGDTLVGGAGDDTLAGGAGDDRYLFDADLPTGNDTLVELAGGGTDVLDFSSTTTVGITLDLSSLTAQVFNGPGDASIQFSAPTFENIIGTEQGDILSGNALVNHLEGRGGNDILRGAGGNDLLDGGLGNDRVDEETDGSATVAPGSLTFSGAFGPGEHTAGEVDTLVGIERVKLTGGDTNNTFDASTFDGVVTLVGGGGNDLLIGTPRGDILNGGSGDDLIYGGDGNDTYQFNADTDAGNDQLFEDPHYVVISGISYNTSIDILDFSSTRGADVTVDLRDTSIQTVAAGMTIWLRSTLGFVPVPHFDGVIGGDGNDTLTGNDLPNLLLGGPGDDRLVDAGSGAIPSIEYLQGGDGNDTYEFHTVSASHHVWILEAVGTGGIDTLDFSAMTGGGITLDLSNGKPQTVDAAGFLQLEIIGCHTIEGVVGTPFADVVAGNSTDNILRGGGGNDILSGARGNDTLEGQGGSDTLIGGRGDDTYLFQGFGGLGTDRIVELPGQGTDTIDYSGLSPRASTFDLSLPLVSQGIGLFTAVILQSGGTVEKVIDSPPPAAPPAPVAPTDPVPAAPSVASILPTGYRAPYLATVTAFASPLLAPASIPMDEPGGGGGFSSVGGRIGGSSPIPTLQGVRHLSTTLSMSGGTTA